MTFSSYYVLAVIVIYLSAFFIRNLKTYYNVKTSIRGRSVKLTFSLLLSTIIYLIALAQLFFPYTLKFAGEISILKMSFLQYVGYGLMMLALLVGLAALYEMRNSWRVGIIPGQKTDLVTTGIYAFSRNPYFLSYNLLFVGICLIYPSIILFVLVIALIIIFHLMILEEEKYLEHLQGQSYISYKNTVARYLFLI